MSAFIITFFIFIVAAVITLGVLQYLRERKRRAALQETARENGWTYLARDSRERPTRYKDFAPFGRGSDRYAHNVMTGSLEGAPFELFDYHYSVKKRTKNGSTTTHYDHKVCVVQMPLPAPGLSIERERLHHKIFDALGGEDIDFESDEFSRRFWVRCRDRRFAYDIIHPAMMEFLMGHRDWHWQWRGEHLLVHRKGKLRPHVAKGTVQMATRFRALVPRHVIAAGAPGSR